MFVALFLDLIDTIFKGGFCEKDFWVIVAVFIPYHD